MPTSASRPRFARNTARAAIAVIATLGLLAAGGCTPPPDSAPPPAAAPAKTPTEVAWKGYEEGLAEAKAAAKPVCLIFYTDWCPHCQNYHKVFLDPAVLAMSPKFVMIKLNKDKEPQLSEKYAPDGNYIPRTYFLKPDGTLMPEVTEQREQYKYFYDESDPASVLRSMKLVSEMKF